MSDNHAIKVRKNKRGITYYCRIWNSLKQNSDTITLGKKTDTFTIKEAEEKYDKIKALYSKGIFNYKPYLMLDNKQKEINDFTLLEVIDKYYENRLFKMKKKFIKNFQDDLKVDYDNIEDNVTFKRKIQRFNSRKKSYYNHIILKIKNDRTSLYDFAQKPFSMLTKFDIEDVRGRVIKKGLAPKTIYNILNEFKAIVNFGINEYEVEMVNPFLKFKEDEDFKKPNDRRNKILNKEELILLFTELEKLPNRNAFIAALMGFCFTARPETVLNIRKKDFNVLIDDNGQYLYDMLYLKNLKNPKEPYKLSIPSWLGQFLYQYLLDHELEEYVLRPKRKGSRFKNPKPLNAISEDYYKTATRLFFFDNILNNLYKDLQEVKETLTSFRKEYVKMYHKAEEYDLKLKKEQIEDLAEYEKEVETKMKQHLNELKSNRVFKNNEYFDFHSLRHQSSTEIAKVNYFYCSYCLSHSEKGLEDEVTRRYSKVELDDLREVLDKTYSQFVQELISNTFEMRVYNYHSLSHKHIYETQFHVQNNIEYKAKRGKDLLKRFKIAKANDETENNPEFYQEITPQMQNHISSIDEHLQKEEKELHKILELEKEMREKRFIDETIYQLPKKLKYKPFG